MKQALRLSLTLILLAALATACSQAESTPTAGSPTNATGFPRNAAGFPRNAAGYADITVHQLANMLDDGKNFTLVNVHIPYEGELAQTDLFIAYNRISDNLDQLPDKEAPIVLYCRSGRMSTEAATVLAGLGYNNVMEVNGGFVAWQAAGFQLFYNP
jgi:rhodanese-related sulfurtransferase